MTRPYNYDEAKRLLTAALHDLEILAGDAVGPTNASWQDVAGTCATNLEVLALRIHQSRRSSHVGPIVFPSPSECLDAAHEVEHA